MDLARVDVDPVLLVVDQPAILPAIPQGPEDLDELLGAIPSILGVGLLGQSVVAGGVIAAPSHDVDRRSTATEMVDRGYLTGDAVRVVIGGVEGRCQADVRAQRGRVCSRGEALQLVQQVWRPVVVWAVRADAQGCVSSTDGSLPLRVLCWQPG